MLQCVDLHILLDFLRIKENKSGIGTVKQTVTAQCTSLETISSMCSNSDTVNYLRELGGINLIWNLCCKTETLQITHSSLFALACIAQNNVYAQQELCLQHVFESLNCLLSSSDISMKTKTLATYLLLSLVSKNKQGQTLILNSSCLGSLMVLFVECDPSLSDPFSEVDERLELLKVVIKTLSYSANVPQNAENQDKLCEILPWIIHRIHSGQKYSEIGQLSCELLTAVVEDNKTCHFKALSFRAVEALILFINFLLPTPNEECLGSAIVALNQLLTDECEEKHWKRFVSFCGSTLLMKLIDKAPSEKWFVYHVNQTLMLLAKCIENCDHGIFDGNFRSAISKSIINLMKAVSDDEYFHKMAVYVLDFVLEVKPNTTNAQHVSNTSFQVPKSRGFLKATPFSPVVNRSSMDMPWSQGGAIWGTSAENCITPICPKKFSSAVKHHAYTTIVVRKRKDGKPEMMLDISKSSKEALKSSSGIQDSPTENVFSYPPSINAQEKVVDRSTSTVFKKPKPLTTYDLKCKLAKRAAHSPFAKLAKRAAHSLFRVRRRRSSVQRLNSSTSGSIIRYSTPKAKKASFKNLFRDESVIQSISSVDDEDVISVCGDIIEKEVLHSASKHRSIKRFGSSGLLIGQNYKCT